MTTVVVGEWEGWTGDTIVELSDGTLWHQTEYVYEYHYAYRPEASVANGVMTVAGMTRPVRVRRISSWSRGTISGAWKGWDGKTVVALTDGTVWEQAEYHYEYRYAFRPDVLIFDGDMMMVKGMSEPVRVRRGRKS